MKILVTGSSGNIGKAAVARLEGLGHETVPFDIQRGDDLRDFQQVRRAASGCDAAVHAGAIPSDIPGREEEVLASNAQGTWNVLLSAVEHGIGRVVHFSSVQSLGYVGDHHPPVYFPVDDAYPRHPQTPYQIGKHLGEETCKAFSDRWGITTVSLRPMLVAHPSMYKTGWSDLQTADMMVDVLWAYTDIDDLVDAVLLSLTAPITGHHAFLVAQDDTLCDTPTLDLVRAHWSDIPHRIDLDAWVAENPFRSLIDCSGLKETLGWSPKRHWRERVAF